MLPSVFYCSLFVAADKLQYQSLDAVNKEGMFVPATNFLPNFFFKKKKERNAHKLSDDTLCIFLIFAVIDPFYPHLSSLLDTKCVSLFFFYTRRNSYAYVAMK